MVKIEIMKYILTITLALILSVTSNISIVYADSESKHKKCDRQAKGLVSNFKKNNENRIKYGEKPIHSKTDLRNAYLDWYRSCMNNEKY
tara:strand:+ start:3965 stop:4231 length:267 start_codon:yes stop_codon:yes gene_type:complete